IHQEWAHWRCATLGGSTFRYSTTAALEPWPMPNVDSSGRKTHLDKVAAEYHCVRDAILQLQGDGITVAYNRFHNPAETSDDIQKLRQLHVEMDNAVAAAYGWTDLNLDHGFHETKQGVRYTISEAARREVLARLLTLNHERYADEVKEGLHETKKKPKASKPKATTKQKATAGATL